MTENEQQIVNLLADGKPRRVEIIARTLDRRIGVVAKELQALRQAGILTTSAQSGAWRWTNEHRTAAAGFAVNELSGLVERARPSEDLKVHVDPEGKRLDEKVPTEEPPRSEPAPKPARPPREKAPPKAPDAVLEALRIVAGLGRGASAKGVAHRLYGGSNIPHYLDATTSTLDGLVADGRAERMADGRYRVAEPTQAGTTASTAADDAGLAPVPAPDGSRVLVWPDEDGDDPANTPPGDGPPPSSHGDDPSQLGPAYYIEDPLERILATVAPDIDAEFERLQEAARGLRERIEAELAEQLAEQDRLMAELIAITERTNPVVARVVRLREMLGEGA